jgi:hypothetical protein
MEWQIWRGGGTKGAGAGKVLLDDACMTRSVVRMWGIMAHAYEARLSFSGQMSAGM